MFGDNFETQCKMGCWALGGGAGIISLYLIAGQTGFIVALLIAVALAVFSALVLKQLFCWPPEEEETLGAASKTATTAMVSAPEAPVPSPPVARAPGAGVRASGGDPAGGPTGTADIATREAKPKTTPNAVAKEALPDGADAVVKGGTLLRGEQDLAGRKGGWSYGNEDGSNAASTSKAKTGKPAAAAAPDDDHGGDDTVGTAPKGLDGPRAGASDNLKEIKGVGPKLEQLLHSMGFYHFDQIAGWSSDEVAWVDANLKGFKGRVSRDNWIEQATILAAGGDTEFSKRVDKGGVY